MFTTRKRKQLERSQVSLAKLMPESSQTLFDENDHDESSSSSGKEEDITFVSSVRPMWLPKEHTQLNSKTQHQPKSSTKLLSEVDSGENNSSDEDDITFVPTKVKSIVPQRKHERDSNCSDQLYPKQLNDEERSDILKHVQEVLGLDDQEVVNLADEKAKNEPSPNSSLFRCSHPNCHKFFKHQIPYQKHLQDHLALKNLPYFCTWPECEGTFRRLEWLQLHAVRVHGAKYWCLWPKCTFMNETKTNTRQHIVEDHFSKLKNKEGYDCAAFMQLRWTTL